jgi:tripartite-type tricarboxylate transporter receptor subunit TctC
MLLSSLFTHKRWVQLLMILCAFQSYCATAQSNYPSRPVKVIIPFLSGGALDQMARIVADNLSLRFKQAFVVEARAGAGGVIGTDYVAKSLPDGYTLLFSVQAPITAAPFLSKQLPYDPQTALVPISLVTIAPNVLIAYPGVAFKTVPELITLAKSAPNKVSFASQGQGTTGHITGAMIDMMAGTKLLHIPYKGFPPMLTDVETGRVDMMFADSINAIPRIKSKELIAIAVAAEKRLEVLPDTPTFAEAGLTGIVSGPQFSLFAPANTPSEIVNKLNLEIKSILKSPNVVSTLKELGVEIKGTTSDEAKILLQAEYLRTRDAVKAAGIQAQ